MRILTILDRVRFRDWRWNVGESGAEHWIQPEFDDIDSEDGAAVVCRGRRWLISEEATDEEIVKTCWLAVEIACRHETMEAFSYLNVKVFHPHTDISALVEAQLAHKPVDRPDPHVAVIKKEVPR